MYYFLLILPVAQFIITSAFPDVQNHVQPLSSNGDSSTEFDSLIDKSSSKDPLIARDQTANENVDLTDPFLTDNVDAPTSGDDSQNLAYAMDNPDSTLPIPADDSVDQNVKIAPEGPTNMILAHEDAQQDSSCTNKELSGDDSGPGERSCSSFSKLR